MNTSSNRLYIIGAGFAGTSIAKDIKRKKIFGQVVAFLDDDENLIGKKFDGIPVIGPIANIASILKCTELDEAIIAIPSASVERIKEIYELLTSGGFKTIKILPSVSQIIEGDAHLVQAREINPLDILGRTPVTLSLKKSLSYLRGKRVLITGAGGSIGSELARQLLSGGAERLYLFGHGENSIYNIDRELHLLQKEGVGEKATIVPIICDMKDKAHTSYIIEKTKCDVVFHCAAYKHVPLMEENQVAAIENNVFGTKNLLDACLTHNVKRFVLISTDKAVEPVSVYGASKYLCEKLVLEYAKNVSNQKARKKNTTRSDTNENAFMFVRFGNVLGSRGSILPLFMEQIKTGGPVTVTDKKMERFFMTIPEACSLVLQTGGVGKNGCSYLLDMGKPVKILDLAEQIIRFSGFEPYKDIPIQFIGKRKGERTIEPLWTKEENPKQTAYKKILRLTNTPFKKTSQKFSSLEKILDELYPICFKTENEKLYRNKDALLALLSSFIPSVKKTKAEQKNV